MGTPIPADYFPHDFFPSLLDESQIGLCVASPVYDNAGLLLDFQIDYINTTGAGMVGLQPTGMIGQEAQRLQMAFDDTELRAPSNCRPIMSSGNSDKSRSTARFAVSIRKSVISPESSRMARIRIILLSDASRVACSRSVCWSARVWVVLRPVTSLNTSNIVFCRRVIRMLNH